MSHSAIRFLLVLSCAAIVSVTCVQTSSLLDSVFAPARADHHSKDTGHDVAHPLSEDERLMAFFEDSWNVLLELSPEDKAWIGIKDEDYGSWNNRSDIHAIAMHKKAISELATLNNFDYDKLSAPRKISFDFYQQSLESQIEAHAYRFHEYALDQEGGQIAELFVFLQNFHEITSVEDAHYYLQRLAGMGAVINQYRINSKVRANKGIIVPAYAFDPLIQGTQSLLNGSPLQDSADENSLYRDFKTKISTLEIADKDKSAMLAKAEKALKGPISKAINSLINELKRQQKLQMNNHGAWALPDGQAYYEHQIKQNTTIALTSQELHQTGLSEVARIHNEMREIMQAMDFDGSLQDFFAFMKTNPDNYYPNTDVGREAFLKDSKQQADQVLAVAGNYFHRLPRADFEVRRVETWREDTAGIAFYSSPSEDGTRPGIYYANLKDMSKVQKYPFVSVAYHEGVPGHHFQIALAQEIENVPSFQKYFGNTAYVEGWALYSEFLAKEMGAFKQPLEDFGRLQEELWRAIRLVVDTGMHAKKWSRERAIEYANFNSPYDEADVIQEIERFMVWPAQAVSYKVGMMKIQELRQKAETALKDKYDVRDYHSVVLENGALPLSVLEKQVDLYIEAKLAQ